MKKKIMILTLCFTLIFSSLNINKIYADNSVQNRAIPPLLVKIAPEVFSALIGVAIEAGIDFATEKEATDYVKGVYLKADSGVFSTSPTSDGEVIDTYKKFERRILDDVKVSSNGKLVLGSVAVALLTDVVGKVFSKNPTSEGYVYTINQVPVYPATMPIGNNSYIMNFYEAYYGYTTPAEKNLYYDYLRYEFIYDSESDIFTKVVYDSYDNKVINTYSGSWLYKNCSYALKYEGGNYGRLYRYDSVGNDNGDIPIHAKVNHVKGNLNISNIGTSGGYDYYKNPTVSDSDFEFSEPSAPGDSPGGDLDFELPSVPEFGEEGIDLSFIGDLFKNLKNKFPFSIPYDLCNLINVFYADPSPPIFDFEFLGNEINLDLTIFEEWAGIIRVFVCIGWVFMLFTFTKKLGG